MDERSYRIFVTEAPARIRVEFAGECIAESSAALVLQETRHPLTYYFPRSDVRTEFLEASTLRTHCPFKGNARYWSVVIGGRRAEDAVWCYEAPPRDCPEIAGYLSFSVGAMDAWFADDEPMPRQVVAAPDAPNPHAMWLMHAADRFAGPDRLLADFAAHLIASGVPLLRLTILVRTLHPELFAWGYEWWRERGVAEAFDLPWSHLAEAVFRDSPYAPILDGEGGVRRSLVDERELDFPILRELRAAGGTDYAAMPMRFSDGQLNILTLVADAPQGFSTAQLGLLHEVLPLLSAMFEVHSQRRLASVVLDTYLGSQTGMRVLEGRIRRGDAETIHALIWFSDLRESTRLTEALGRDAYLALLNEFFDCMAGAVLAHGGEVLKYIGDAVMAIFPIEAVGEAQPTAARDALEAARAAAERVDALNARRRERGEAAIDFGIALHRGEFTYGNIGTARRLDFTVIGGAANEAARIEALTKTLGVRILVSDAAARSLDEALPALGEHELRGVNVLMTLFAGETDRSRD